jgi:Nucleotidyl transferase AbiEii toxin, Type IV TA system
MSAPRYENPQALRQALADRLRPLAEESGMELSALLRQFAYDRLLCRVFSAEPERWVLKGATAMLARLEGQARHTLDVDLHRRDGSLADAERALREAAAVDLGDYFRFTLGASRQKAQGADAVRISVVAILGATDFGRFHVDLVVGLSMTGAPENAPPPCQSSCRVYPVRPTGCTRSPTTSPTRSARCWSVVRAPTAMSSRAPATGIWPISPPSRTARRLEPTNCAGHSTPRRSVAG